MGRYDDISDAKLRYEVQRFARILQSMEEKNEVLDRTADILTLLGELRRMVFAWEVRSTFRGDEGASPGEAGRGLRDPDQKGGAESDSDRIVREAREQQSDLFGGTHRRPDENDDPPRPPSDGGSSDPGPTP